MTQNQKTVFVGLSGGVDSSVAALRLKTAGYNVVGVFIKVWHPPFMVCNWEQERLDAMRVAAHLKIPFLTCDAETTYQKEVADYFIAEYQAGRTPNPDVLCNQKVKFGAFLEFAKQKDADAIATGHYAQSIRTGTGNELHRGVDASKDQSYFLWSLLPEQLDFTIFPVGDTTKSEIREEAMAAHIPIAHKKDSQGICFLGHVDIPEFLSHYIDLVPGAVLDERGEVIGTHQGALVYTLGQRHGFSLHTKDPNRAPMFVLHKNITDNTITVGAEKPQLAASDLVTLSNYVLRADLTRDDVLEVQFRYRQSPIPAIVVSVDAPGITLKINQPTTEEPALGQSCVLYQGTHCIGGGIITSCQS